jgi:hypothetical protein
LAKKNNPPMTTHRTEQEEVSVIQEEVSVLWNIATADIGILQIPLEIRRKVFQICKDTEEICDQIRNSKWERLT